MTRLDAMARLAADYRQHEADTQTLGYPRTLMLADAEAVKAIVRPLGCEESEAKRQGSGEGESVSGSAAGDHDRSSWGDPVLRGAIPSGALASALPMSDGNGASASEAPAGGGETPRTFPLAVPAADCICRKAGLR